MFIGARCVLRVWIARRVFSSGDVCSHTAAVCVARYHLLRSPASVTKAAKKTLEMSMETVEHSAESAARATEEALERTTEKVKRKASLSRSPSAQRPDGDL